MKYNIIGVGRLGMHIAYALQHNNLGDLQAVYNDNWNSTQLAVKALGFGNALRNIADIPKADITFITVPDGNIEEVVQYLVSCPLSGIYLHCSGALSSQTLVPLRSQHSSIASLHPLKSFKSGAPKATIFQDCYCTVEGDHPALTKLSLLFNQLGARIFTVKTKDKALYHAGAVIASNYLVTVAAIANHVLEKAGIETSLAKKMSIGLMQSSLDNIRECSKLEEALTGPLMRGDKATIEMHLQALHEPALLAFYKAMAKATLPLTNLEDAQRESIEQLLS